ncbi:MAG: hypothetical protein J6T15_02180 [Bacilli bacterium]|nr:hypothetical protein [Bacilli bacterium]
MKTKLKILNIFYFLFSIVAIAAYVLSSNSFLRTTFHYEVDSNALVEASIDESALEELGISIDDLFSDVSKVVFEVDVNVSYSDLLTSWTEAGSTGKFGDFQSFNSVERYAMKYILKPAFDNTSDWLEEQLTAVANAAIGKMIENVTVSELRTYSLAVVGNPDPFDAMDKNQNNTGHYNKLQFEGTVSDCTQLIFRTTYDEIYFNGAEDLNGNKVVVGFNERIVPYFKAIKEPDADDNNEMNAYNDGLKNMKRRIAECLQNYGVFDETGAVTYIEEAIGTILQHLLNHVNYEDERVASYNLPEIPDNKFVNKFFAPLKGFILDEGDFDSLLTEMFVNVIRESNANDGGRLFYMIALGARVFAVILVLCLLGWAIKFIMAFISFFRQKPFLRINPLFIITGTIEAIFALLTLGSYIIFQFYTIDAIKSVIPAVANLIPVGLSLQIVFAAWIPGVLAILNLLFSVLYGPVKRKFKEDSRDEILYSTDFNDYE